MTKVAILMDTSLCVECQACRVACQNHNQLPAPEVYLKFRFLEQGEYPNVNHFISRFSCVHCTHAACVEVCPTGTLFKGESGFTYVDKKKCSGCGYCTNVCPYGVANLVDGVISKCQGCMDLVEDGKEPACVDTCISKCLQFGSHNDMLSIAEKRVEQLKEKYPRANIYGADQVGGLGLILILRDEPAVFDLPVKPAVDSSIGLWKEVVQPGGLFLAAAAVATTSLSYIVAKRNHHKELKEK